MERKTPVIGSIVERKPPSSFTPPKSFSSGKTGFPTVQHRSKSAFARNREDLRKTRFVRPKDVPPVYPSSKHASPPPPSLPVDEADDWREQISKENEERVASMTEEEREQERREILERFGANVGNLLRRARIAREKQREGKDMPGPMSIDPQIIQSSEDEVPLTSEKRETNHERVVSPPPSALASAIPSRSSSRADRRLRFAELEPQDVYVYDNAPSPKKRRALALPPPDPNDADTVSLGQWHGKMASPSAVESLPSTPREEESSEPEEGSAEYIRQHFFPFAPKDDPSLAWMSTDLNLSDSSSSALRFDLHGNPIPSSLALSLPTHLGLHHHAEGTHAGYTLDDIFLLTRSTVPAQRAMMLGILVRIAQRLGRVKKGIVEKLEEYVGREEELRKRILAAGVEAMSDKGNIGPLAIEIVWECIVGWDPDFVEVEGVELDSPSDSAINTLPLEFILPQINVILKQGAVPPESCNQLLSVLHRLAQQSNSIAGKIVSTVDLLSTVLQFFLLTPVPNEETSPLPNPLALRLFYTLAQSSRANAQAIDKFADSFLRFVTFSPFSSPYPPALATNLLVATLRVYRVLATYGLYAHIAGTVQEQLSDVERYAVSEACHSPSLVIAWSNLVETWTVCAIDPHQTTPPHDILWTQITSWAWYEGMSDLQSHLDVAEKDWAQWAASWKVQAAWLEGCRINGVKGGEAERVEFIEGVRIGFENGTESKVVASVMKVFQNELEQQKDGDTEHLKRLATYADPLSSVIRLWLACLNPHTEGAPTSPPFLLPFSQISELARNLLINGPLWSMMTSLNKPTGCLFVRQLSRLLSFYLRLSKRLPDVSQNLWIAQAFSILLWLVPGDESAAQEIVQGVTELINPEWTSARNIMVPTTIWHSGGMEILKPFYSNIIRPQQDVIISPLTITSQSIKASTTDRLPSATGLPESGLPLRQDWTLAPLDHLLRSGDSAVFKKLPISWDASETDVARISLLLTRIAQEALFSFSMSAFALTREGAVLGCMKIFMLEHDQPHTDSAGEVFRDDVVLRLMTDVLHPYEYGVVSHQTSLEEDIEKAATKFLGPSVPFFQFYTDFVALYDAISFSHPLFGRLLLPPISMRYALDYRKHLWSDFNHVIRTIRVAPDHVISADIREYLYPLETDSQIIASYLSSLLKGNIHDFVKLIAIHHIASNIWPDLQGWESRNEERANALLKAVITQGSVHVVREIVQYCQVTIGKPLVPPTCFISLSAHARTQRLDFVFCVGGQSMVDRLRGLLEG
ncbi:hypothetical protein BDN70DRAFT_895913 [Pholiota conissans]|uniref:RNA polymerase II-associated protein 1 C-terminal domain-containing protein n=1 Tax=Pholiota conissans TaxID=109636 RepID=A0A9P5YYR2_9AGAR|nr:hypothetical protein BDN70DRAFT_895913 [Pholiota conissans]